MLDIIRLGTTNNFSSLKRSWQDSSNREVQEDIPPLKKQKIAENQKPLRSEQQKSILEESSTNTEDQLHNSKRTLILKDEYKEEFQDLILEYTKLLPEWLKGSLDLMDAGESIGNHISWNEEMMENPKESVIATLEAAMQLIEKEDIDIYCLNSPSTNELSKDETIEYLLGRICSKMDINQELSDQITENFYSVYADLSSETC